MHRQRPPSARSDLPTASAAVGEGANHIHHRRPPCRQATEGAAATRVQGRPESPVQERREVRVSMKKLNL
jgi:hypothetical protein